MDLETLGQKHKKLNEKVLNAILANPGIDLEDIDYNKPDIDNLFQIDVACRTRNVDYLLKVFKCNDMLYISRAIKHSVWLIRDPQYSHIINPKYLYTELFPFMLFPAKNKLLLSIRLNLKDPTRNEEFLNYLKDVDLNMAVKWFSNCSVHFIKSKIEDDIYRIPDSMLPRLFSVSIDSLKSYVKNTYWYKPMLQKSMFLLGINGDEYFDILDNVLSNQIPKFNAKYTKLAMKHCPRRLMMNFERYITHIDEDVFVKYISIDHFQDFLDAYSSNSKVKVLFPEEKCEKILKCNEHNLLLAQLMHCDTENLQQLKEILHVLRNNYLDHLKFRLHFINVVIKRFCIHHFDMETWGIFNDILSRMGVYSEYKKHYRPCIKAALTYYVLNNLVVPEEIISKFDFDTFKYEKNKLTIIERKIIFDYLVKYSTDKLQTDDKEQVLTGLDNVLLLFHDWKEDWTKSPTIATTISSLVEPLKATKDIEALKKLYQRKRPWRKLFIHESYIINTKQDACLNMLKHDPKLLYDQKILEDLCLKEDLSIMTFLEKTRTYWPHSLARDFRTIYQSQLPRAPHRYILKLLSQSESIFLVESNIPQEFEVDWNKLEEISMRKSIAKNMHISRPQPSLDIVLLYAKGVYLQDSFSSIRATLHTMSSYQTQEYINRLQNWPEFVQKLCVLQAFTKLNKHERDIFILNIWKSTQFCSVRAVIFKHYFNSLKKYTKNDMNSNDAYKETVKTVWDTFKSLVASLTENECVTVYVLLRKFEKMPLIIRTEYCEMAFKFFRNLPKYRNSQKFMNIIVTKLDHNHVLHNLDLDLLADMVNETIIKRLWSEKLDWTYSYLLIKWMMSEKENDKITIKFDKILKPVLNKAYEMWDSSVLNLYLVKFNIYNLSCRLNSSYKDILQQTHNATSIILVAESLLKNLPLSENYVLLTNVRLAAVYMKILTTCERKPPKKLYEQTVKRFSKVCLKIFIKDVTSIGHSIIQLFYHALQKMLYGFNVEKSIQYKLFNCMLDLSEGQTEHNVYVNLLVLQHTYTVSFGKEDNKERKNLHERIKSHPSSEVKAHFSNLINTETCNHPYYSMHYTLTRCCRIVI